MIPVLTPTQVSEVDRAAPDPVAVLIDRAGLAVARSARRLLRGTYGRRIAVIAGPGNNGHDGRVAARYLEGWGARCAIVDPAQAAPELLAGSDLVVDAAFGTGLSRVYDPPDPPGAPVLAVDIPSGINGLTGMGSAMAAARTVTFAAYKPGLLLGDGADRAGVVELAPIGLEDLAREIAACWLVEDGDLAGIPARPRTAHKWQTAVMVVGGSPVMLGAPMLSAHAAMRAGAGYALVGVPGGAGLPAGEHVGVQLPGIGWATAAVVAARRVKALVVGPGLGSGAGHEVARLLAATAVPAVVDADGLNSFGSLEEVKEVAGRRQEPLILTPHEGEYEKLCGHRPAADRIADVQEVARETGAVVLLKGPTTVVAAPDGRVRLAAAGRPNLATAGTGDVLSGVIAAFLARGVDALEAAALGAHVHGRAAQTGRQEGLVASDLPELVSDVLSSTRPGPARASTGSGR